MAGWLNNSHANCSDFHIPKTGTWLDILWAWIKASVSNTCLGHYLMSLISLSICLALLSSLTYRYFMSTRNYGRVVKLGNQYRVTLMLTFAIAIGWSTLCGWEIYESYHSNWSSVPFNECIYALAQTLIWWTFVAMLCFERWQALSHHTSLLRVCWTLYCTSFSICEGYSITECLFTKETRFPPMSFYNLLGIFTIFGSLILFAISLSGKTWFSITTEDLGEPLLGRHINSTTVGKKEEVTWYCKAGIFSRITFTWLNPLLLNGSKRILQFEDIPNMGPDDSADVVHERLESNWDPQNGSVKSLLWALAATFWPLFTINGILALVKLCVMYAGPLLIQHFINFAADSSGTWQQGVKLALILFFAKSIEVVADHQYSFLSQKLGLSVHAALVASVYHKGLRLTSAARQKHGVGRIVNHMSVDVPEIADAFVRAHDLWVLPIQIGLALAILYSVVGLATLTGLATMVATMVICILIAHKLQSYTVKTMACKDARIKVTNEAISNMKIIKLQAWQDRFLHKVKNARVAERGWITKSMYITAMSIFMLWLSPLAVSVFTFGSCLVLNINLTAGRVFTALSTFRILQDPLRAFPQTMLQASQALVALRRLLEYFQGDELKLETVERLIGGEDCAVIVKSGYFKWDSNSTCPTLRNINLEVKCGTLVAIVGTVGSGKSALLGCILGELEKVSGQVRVSGQLAYVSQSAWIQNGTIQNNILFGKPMNEALYKETIRVCSLQSDLAHLPHGDQTEIGERGINLSGGQKQRIQLARAIYQEADIYILDDIFSAVDAHTGTELFKECLRGALASKTVFLVTHQVEFLHSVDLIMVMRDGEIVQSGRHEELVELGLDFGALVDAHNQSLEMVETHYGGTDNDDISCASSMSSLNGFHLAFSPQRSSPLAGQLQDSGLIFQSLKSSEHILANNSLSRQTSENLNMSSSEDKGSATLIDDEERARGQVTFNIYWAYCTKVFKGGHVVALILIQICWQGLQIASDFWLAKSTSTQETFQPKRFITIYGELAIGSGIFVLMRSLLISSVGLQTAQKFFVEMIESVFNAPMSFFDTTPTGRILSRSSKDQMIVDLSIPFSYGTFLALVFQLIGALYVTVHITWQILFIILPLIILYLQYQRYFIASSRELTRLESISDAPIIHHFSETMYGLSTIRAFGHQERFFQMNIQRLNTNLSISFHNRGANEWLGFRLESIGIAILCSSALLLILLPSGLIQPELVGLSLSYGMALSSCLFFMTWAMGTIEQNMIAVERIQQYTSLPGEGPFLIKDRRPTNGWPLRGGLVVQGLKMRYRPETPLVLKGLTFTIRGGEKLGVVGRTGSGKTSLIQALFRLVEPADGRILIDGLDISTIGLNDLRSRLSIIPQEPTLFEGTVRSNIDPLEEHQDVDIWEVLEKCQLVDTIKQKDEKLDAPVAENGDNWSMGQRQLFCLGRALLKKSRILVLDEATASVDTQTDAILQRIIRTEFAHCTVLSIAHRMPSVMDSDKVLVLDAGHMKEFGAPGVLLENPSSLFSLLVQEYWNRSNCPRDIVGMSNFSCM